mmetsp:Transcript_128286/g.235244  ORF Transcript_128286/g.235244 Transcript_128286/m.235244 type:complete len:133 (+) Transcript_128286:233-631(+)
MCDVVPNVCNTRDDATHPQRNECPKELEIITFLEQTFLWKSNNGSSLIIIIAVTQDFDERVDEFNGEEKQDERHDNGANLPIPLAVVMHVVDCDERCKALANVRKQQAEDHNNLEDSVERSDIGGKIVAKQG